MLNKRKFKGGLLTFWTDPVMLNHKYIYVKSAICRRKEAATVEEVMEKVLRSGMDLLVGIGRYALPALAFLIVLRCLFSLLRNRPRPKTEGSHTGRLCPAGVALNGRFSRASPLF